MKRISSMKHLYGIYRGIVVYNRDPLELGRCKVRVPPLHGSDTPEMVELLPWARMKNPTPSGKDSGTFIVPEVGMNVWVQFEGGDKYYPIYEGGYHGIVEGDNEVPSESREGMKPSLSPRGNPVKTPTAWTLFKSPKGTTIGGQEDEEKESFWIVDRAGQIFKSLTKMKKETLPREGRDMTRDKKFEYSETLTGKILTLFKSFGGSFIKFVSEENKERVDLVSSDRDKSRISGISNRSTSGNVESFLISKDGDKEVSLRINSSQGTAAIEINGSPILTIEGDQVYLNATLKVQEIEVEKLTANTIDTNFITTCPAPFPCDWFVNHINKGLDGKIDLDLSDEE